MAKKTKAKETTAKAVEETKSAPKKAASAEDKLRKESADYFKRFPNCLDLYGVEGSGFFFKKGHAENAAKGKKVYHFKRA